MEREREREREGVGSRGSRFFALPGMHNWINLNCNESTVPDESSTRILTSSGVVTLAGFGEKSAVTECR